MFYSSPNLLIDKSLLISKILSITYLWLFVRLTLMPNDHFKVYREHTSVKHAILKDYLNAWVPILSSWNKRICYIDGFCGPGSYEARGSIYNGSPIIALKVAKEFSGKAELVCIFIDKNKDYCEALGYRIHELGLEGKYYIEHAEFEEVITALLDKVANLVPAFCFIDPFGYSGLPLRVIERFLQRPATEAFINFMYEPISRFITVKAQHPYMDELFGTRKWRYVLGHDFQQDEREIFVRDLYHQQLKTCAKYVWPFQLKDPVRGRTIYYLFHCTNHRKGIKVMKEVMYRAGTNGTYSYQGKESSQMSLFSAEPSIKELDESLLDKFAGSKVTFNEIIDSTLDWPFIEKHYREVLNKLNGQELIRKIPITTKTQRGFNGKDIAVFSEKAKRRKKLKGFGP